MTAMDAVTERYGLSVGDTVKVTAGRKVPKGTVGFVADAYSPYCHCNARYNRRSYRCYCPYRLEIVTGDGDSHFVANVANVTRLTELGTAGSIEV